MLNRLILGNLLVLVYIATLITVGIIAFFR